MPAACRITKCHTGMCSRAQVQPNFSLHGQQTMHTHVALRRAGGLRAAYMRGRRDCTQASATGMSPCDIVVEVYTKIGN